MAGHDNRPRRGATRSDPGRRSSPERNPVPKTHKTALVVIPPKALWEPIQAIRERHDARFARWMPHLTLLYPFAPPERWERLFPRLIQAGADLGPFPLSLTSIRHFKHGDGSFTLWLAPEAPGDLQRLQQRLLRAAPGYDDTRHFAGGYTPHLSLGQVARRASLERLLEQLRQDWRPLEFQVEEVTLIRRGDPPEDRFQVVRGFRLGSEPRP